MAYLAKRSLADTSQQVEMGKADCTASSSVSTERDESERGESQMGSGLPTFLVEVDVGLLAA
jgi:hypothetical protein